MYICTEYRSLGRGCWNWSVAGGEGELIVLSLSAGPSGSVFLWGRCISVMVQCATWRASAALFQAADGFGDVDEVVGDTLAVG